ncbi:MAG TPA: UDP-glucose 4-epimerase GalE [Pirellulaceae bacterium]|nr:UDP-glucose 4-epimerase GalE [Pirellulaceae bacterium]HMO91658.1 UDP-glucose 4-epimerase GalE [Pirellulaceae bacterium]HMP68355.1 UDP-glucose 4-epimerase GalE [Pirellulaceae bacterium]
MNVLVVGGAGYIGSHMVRCLDQQGHRVVVLDNLSTGFRAAVNAGVFVHGELGDATLVRDLLRQHRIDAVMHFAACALVNESVISPHKYYKNNVIDALVLLDTMRQCEVTRLVFSSTCATYGIPEAIPIVESEKQMPINPYGFTKLVFERALEDYSNAYGFGYAALRYFNAAGASPDGDIGEDHDPETHLIPIVLQTALSQRSQVTIYGTDYPTPDGTCIRDYIHVDDLAAAHLLALEKLDVGSQIKLNLGTGNGFSVRQVIDACEQVTGCKIPVIEGERRAGDPPILVANASAAKRQLGWVPEYQDVKSIVETAWAWHRKHPHGYPKGG